MSSQYKLTHNLSDAQVVDIFQRHLEENGFVFDKDHPQPVMNGQTQYCKTNNHMKQKNMNKRNGWYRAFMNPSSLPAARYGWMNGDNPSFSWSLYSHLTGNDSSKLVKMDEITAKKKAAEAEERRLQHEKDSAENYKLFVLLSRVEQLRCIDVQPHAYLTEKGISLEEAAQDIKTLNPAPFNEQELMMLLPRIHPKVCTAKNIENLLLAQSERLKYKDGRDNRKNRLFIGSYNIDNRLIGFQLINEYKDKQGRNKWFLKGMRKHGSFHPVNDKKINDAVIIVEGWATGIALRKITGNSMPILVCWDKGNMLEVARQIRLRHWNAEIYIAIDNDHKTKQFVNEEGETITKHANAGAEAGLKTSNLVCATLLTPPFDRTDPAQDDFSDWDDYLRMAGLQEAEFNFVEMLTYTPKGVAKIENPAPLISNIGPSEDLIIPNMHIGFICLTKMVERGFLNPDISDDVRLNVYREMLAYYDDLRVYEPSSDQSVEVEFIKRTCRVVQAIASGIEQNILASLKSLHAFGKNCVLCGVKEHLIRSYIQQYIDIANDVCEERITMDDLAN